ncbi:MAG: hypothetical protein P8019_15245 [Gammaproteobacteria bacterium]
MVVAPARFTPKCNFRSFAAGKSKAAAKGAAAGAEVGAVSTFAFATEVAREMFIAPYLALLVVPISAVTGAILGSRASFTK